MFVPTGHVKAVLVVECSAEGAAKKPGSRPGLVEEFDVGDS
jgi:hypothetical protein